MDRKKEMIVTGSFNVWSVEVEKVLQPHPAMMQCAVMGIHNDKWGEATQAAVELEPGMRVSPDELVALRKQAVEFVDTLPRSAVGKVLKRDLRER